MDILSQIRIGGITYILLLVAITMREYGRALFGHLCGDPLPSQQGRVTINPAAHMDTMGTVVLPLLTIALSVGANLPIVFGWGKPVELALSDPKTRVRTDVVVAVGGNLMNLAVAFVSALAITVLAFFKLEDFIWVAYYSVVINCTLFVLNMLPIPPLDGGRLLKYATNMASSTYYKLSSYGFFIVMAVIFIPATGRILSAVIGFLSGIFLFVANALYSLIS